MAEIGSQPNGYRSNQNKRKHHDRHPAKRPQHPRKRGRGPPQHNYSAPATMAPTPICCICTDPQKIPSYKCPKCRAHYCSVLCCKEHKTVCPGKPPNEQLNSGSPFLLDLAPLKPPPQNSKHGIVGDDAEDSLDDGWKLTFEMKLALEQSEWLRKQLEDGGLRDIIRQIVESRNVEGLRQAQQRFPQFRVFLDKLLVVAGILEREKDPELEFEPLEDWLERDWSQDSVPPNLSLKPFRRKVPVFQLVDNSSASSEEEGDSSSEEASSNGSATYAVGDSTEDEHSNRGEA